jgi:hypothetical protein
MEWTPSIEVTALDLIDTYVANGFGIGLSLALPGKRPSAGLRALPIAELPPLVIGTLWREPEIPAVTALRAVLKARATAVAETDAGTATP